MAFNKEPQNTEENERIMFFSGYKVPKYKDLDELYTVLNDALSSEVSVTEKASIVEEMIFALNIVAGLVTDGSQKLDFITYEYFQGLAPTYSKVTFNALVSCGLFRINSTSRGAANIDINRMRQAPEQIDFTQYEDLGVVLLGEDANKLNRILNS